MLKTKYSYNPKTLKYERVGIRWGKLAFSLVSGLVFAGIFLAALVYIQSKFFETGYETRLRQENEALASHKTQVASELENARITLTSLKEKEADLHKKIFFTEKPIVAEKMDKTEEIVKFELDDFKALTSSMLKETNNILSKTKASNSAFAKLFWPSKTDVAELFYYPTKTPVQNFTKKQLASGFGSQINPFNKRLYRHNGIDIICERGTEVLATGKGTVVAAVNDATPGGKGTYVVIEHINGYQTRYAHLSFVSVSYGQKIAQGQVIGMVGSTGSAVAPHLHYEVLKNGRVVNPIYFFVEDMSESELYELAQVSKQVKQSLD